MSKTATVRRTIHTAQARRLRAAAAELLIAAHAYEADGEDTATRSDDEPPVVSLRFYAAEEEMVAALRAAELPAVWIDGNFFIHMDPALGVGGHGHPEARIRLVPMGDPGVMRLP